MDIGFYIHLDIDHDSATVYPNGHRIFLKLIGKEWILVKMFDEFGRTLTLKADEFIYLLGLIDSI